MNTKRIEWVDTLRAFAMFLIVLGHTLRGSSIYYVLYSFHVPLCIMISGFCFNPNRKWNEVLSRLIKRLYAPYLIFGAISICVYIAIAPIAEGHSVVANTPTYLLGLIYGNGNLGMSVGGYMRWNLPMWYIPCTIAVEIAAYLLIRTAGALLHCKEHIICLVGLTMSIIVSGLIPLESVDLPFGLETAFALLPFFLLGILLRIIWDNGIICVRGGGDNCHGCGVSDCYRYIISIHKQQCRLCV